MQGNVLGQQKTVVVAAIDDMPAEPSVESENVLVTAIHFEFGPFDAVAGQDALRRLHHLSPDTGALQRVKGAHGP